MGSIAADPALRQALAIAIVKRRRDGKWQLKAEGLEAQVLALTQRVQQLEESASRHPLEALAALQQAGGEQPAGSQQQPAAALLPQLPLWQQASLQLPPSLRRFCCHDVPQYLLQKELSAAAAAAAPAAVAGPPANSYALLCCVLSRTPLQAVLESVDDVLELVAAASSATAASNTGPGSLGQPCAPLAALPALSEAHGACLAQAAEVLAALVGSPAPVRGEHDVQSVQLFLECLLQAACQPLPAAQGAGVQHAAAGALPAPETAAPSIPVVGQALPAVARRMVDQLTRHPCTGMLALSSTAAAARACVHSLVCAVTGEDLVPSGQAACSGGQPAGAAAEEESEDVLDERFQYIAGVLQAQLRALPRWAAQLGGCDGGWLDGVAGEVMAAADTCKLVSLSHPATARQAQRCQALLVSALHQIASSGGGMTGSQGL